MYVYTNLVRQEIEAIAKRRPGLDPRIIAYLEGPTVTALKGGTLGTLMFGDTEKSFSSHHHLLSWASAPEAARQALINGEVMKFIPADCMKQKARPVIRVLNRLIQPGNKAHGAESLNGYQIENILEMDKKRRVHVQFKRLHRQARFGFKTIHTEVINGKNMEVVALFNEAALSVVGQKLLNCLRNNYFEGKVSVRSSGYLGIKTDGVWTSLCQYYTPIPHMQPDQRKLKHYEHKGLMNNKEVPLAVEDSVLWTRAQLGEFTPRLRRVHFEYTRARSEGERRAELAIRGKRESMPIIADALDRYLTDVSIGVGLYDVPLGGFPSGYFASYLRQQGPGSWALTPAQEIVRDGLISYYDTEARFPVHRIVAERPSLQQVARTPEIEELITSVERRHARNYPIQSFAAEFQAQSRSIRSRLSSTGRLNRTEPEQQRITREMRAEDLNSRFRAAYPEIAEAHDRMAQTVFTMGRRGGKTELAHRLVEQGEIGELQGVRFITVDSVPPGLAVVSYKTPALPVRDPRINQQTPTNRRTRNQLEIRQQQRQGNKPRISNLIKNMSASFGNDSHRNSNTKYFR